MQLVIVSRGVDRYEAVLSGTGSAKTEPHEHPLIGPLLGALSSEDPTAAFLLVKDEMRGRLDKLDQERLARLAEYLDDHSVAAVDPRTTPGGPRLVIHLRAHRDN